jgi:c(7)-type cytochrome triheme protein
MKIKNNNLGKLIGILMTAILVLTLGQALKAEEGYDEDLHGPAYPIIWSKPVAGVIFNHKTHTFDNGLDCDSCHDGLFEMAAGDAEGKNDFNMASLYKGNYCGACHDGSTAFASNTRCTTCHIGVKGQNRLLGSKK